MLTAPAPRPSQRRTSAGVSRYSASTVATVTGASGTPIRAAAAPRAVARSTSAATSSAAVYAGLVPSVARGLDAVERLAGDGPGAEALHHRLGSASAPEADDGHVPLGSRRAPEAQLQERFGRDVAGSGASRLGHRRHGSIAAPRAGGG